MDGPVRGQERLPGRLARADAEADPQADAEAHPDADPDAEAHPEAHAEADRHADPTPTYLVTATVMLQVDPDPYPTDSVTSGAGDTATDTEVATLRVIDDPKPQGLLESILGDVAHAFGF